MPKLASSRLASESDAVLMDLRGFSIHNRGCIYEITELINLVPLERVLLLIDGRTDEEFLRQTAEQAWDDMRATSPNRSGYPGRLRLFRFSGSRRGELRRLLGALSVAATCGRQLCDCKLSSPSAGTSFTTPTFGA